MSGSINASKDCQHASQSLRISSSNLLTTSFGTSSSSESTRLNGKSHLLTDDKGLGFGLINGASRADEHWSTEVGKTWEMELRHSLSCLVLVPSFLTR